MSVARKLTSQTMQMQELATIIAPVPPSCVGLADQVSAEEVLRYALDYKLNHICQRQGLNFDMALKTADVMISDPETYFQYPTATILRPDAISPQTEQKLCFLDYRFTESGQKQDLLNQIIQLLAASSVGQTVIEDVVSVADELFTNALYNAPFINLDTQRNPGINRQDVEVRLEDGKFGRLFLGLHEKRLIIGCQDPYGSLSLQRYLQKIRESYLRGPAATINFGAGGAGIGSYIIFNAGSSLYFGVKPRQMTTLCCEIPLGLSYRKRLAMPKHLHWFQL